MAVSSGRIKSGDILYPEVLTSNNIIPVVEMDPPTGKLMYADWMTIIDPKKTIMVTPSILCGYGDI